MNRIFKYLFLSIICCLSAIQVNAQTAEKDTTVNQLQQLYSKVNHDIIGIDKQKYQPLIGISTYHSTHRDSGAHTTYINAVIRAGGIPVLIPMTTNNVVLYQLISRLDGIILTGGEDVATSFYGEQPIPEMGKVDSLRDVYDLTIIKLAAKKRLPMLGICRGEQLINVAFGGTLYQDLPAQFPSSVIHDQKESSTIGTHGLSVLPNTQLARILPDSIFLVNSFHHQAIKDVAPGFKATAYSPDHVVEAIESSPKQNIIAVQFHPECLIMSSDDTMLCIFKNLIDRANIYYKKRMKR